MAVIQFAQTVDDTDLYKNRIKFVNENLAMNCIGENNKSVVTIATTDLYMLSQEFVNTDRLPAVVLPLPGARRRHWAV